MAVTPEDVITWVCVNYDRPVGDVRIDEGLPGTLKITVYGITSQQQIDIHNRLQDQLPAGLRLDVHRGFRVVDHLRTRKPGPAIRREPLWDVED